MSLKDKVLLTIIAALGLTTLALWAFLSESQANLHGCQVSYADAAVKWRADAAAAQAEIDALGTQVGTLEADIDSWRTRALNADTTTREVIRTVVRRLPADCRVCVENYELNRRYTNPGPEPPPDSIVVNVTDVLGLNQASWQLDMPNLCPACPPLPPPCNQLPQPASNRLGMLVDVGAGYGIAGPEIDAGLYPLTYSTKRYTYSVGGRGHINMTDQGDVVGNALLEVRIGRRGYWK